MQIAFKAFNNDLICRDMQYTLDDWNYAEYAQCVESGLHAAMNPLDCLGYYSWSGNRFFQVLCAGDIQEDRKIDSKLACTKLKLLKELTAVDMVIYSMKYVYENPKEPLSRFIQIDTGTCSETDVFAICYGQNPKIKGKKNDVLGLIQVDESNNIIALNLIIIDGKEYKAGKYYDMSSIN